MLEIDRDADRLPAAATPTAQPVTRDQVAIGASGGGVTALRQLVAALPADLPATLYVVMHLSSDRPSHLAQILSRHGPLPAVPAEDGMRAERGRIHVAQPDCHLLVEGDTLRVLRGPRENRHRPAIDPLFRSIAWSHGPRAVGVVLTGALDDGSAGLWAIKSCGGTTVVQEPAEAEHPQMPIAALKHNRIDHQLALADIAALLVRLAKEPLPAAAAPAQGAAPTIGEELAATRLQGHGIAGAQTLGTLSPFTCPSCGGALWQMDEGGALRYRCHTGHAFSPAGLLDDQGRAAENALYVALRAVEEKVEALRRLAHRSEAASLRSHYEGRARQFEGTAATLRGLLGGAPL